MIQAVFSFLGFAVFVIFYVLIWILQANQIKKEKQERKEILEDFAEAEQKMPAKISTQPSPRVSKPFEIRPNTEAVLQLVKPQQPSPTFQGVATKKIDFADKLDKASQALHPTPTPVQPTQISPTVLANTPPLQEGHVEVTPLPEARTSSNTQNLADSAKPSPLIPKRFSSLPLVEKIFLLQIVSEPAFRHFQNPFMKPLKLL
jgi:nitrogen fixation-related uncharacterized protein